MKLKFYIIAGANGSGKTTFTKSFANIHKMYFINADEIAKELDPKNITKNQVKAGRIFFEELKKKKVTLTLKDQDEWEEYFEAYQKELLEIKAQIDITDKQIDEMVYSLYGLSEDEVAVVEGR